MYRLRQSATVTHLGGAIQQVNGPLPAPPAFAPGGMGKLVAREFSVRGIEARIAKIRELIKENLLDVEISRRLALGITAGCPRRGDLCELQALWNFMHGTRPNGLPNVRYTGDIQGYDTFQSPRATLSYGGGDCDDGTILVAVLALGNQFAVKGRITVNPGGDGWGHIYPWIGLPKLAPTMWWPFDWVLGYHYFGVAPPESRHVEFDGFRQVYSPGIIGPNDYEGW